MHCGMYTIRGIVSCLQREVSGNTEDCTFVCSQMSLPPSTVFTSHLPPAKEERLQPHIDARLARYSMTGCEDEKRILFILAHPAVQSKSTIIKVTAKHFWHIYLTVGVLPPFCP